MVAPVMMAWWRQRSLFFFLILLIGRFALRGKGVVSGKLASILVMFIVAWALIAVSNLSLAD